MATGVYIGPQKFVVVDDKKKPASTGGFEEIYKAGSSKVLVKVEGTSVLKVPITSYFFYTGPTISPLPETSIKCAPSMIKQEQILPYSPRDYIKEVGKGMRTTLENLLEILHKEKNRRTNIMSIKETENSGSKEVHSEVFDESEEKTVGEIVMKDLIINFETRIEEEIVKEETLQNLNKNNEKATKSANRKENVQRKETVQTQMIRIK